MTDGLVIEIEKEILQSDSDVLSALRKAHVLATKLRLKEFDEWIQGELNGYKCSPEEVPDYRTVHGTLKAFNPMRGWIPAQIQNAEIEKTVCEKVLTNAISELIELCKESEGVVSIMPTGEQSAFLSRAFGFETQYKLDVSSHLLASIIEKVKNVILDWALKLESEGVLGEGLSFTEEDRIKAKDVTDGITVVINPKADSVNIITSTGNTITFNYKDAEEALAEIKTVVDSESLSDDDRETARELLQEINEKISAKEKPSKIKALMTGLKDFLINAGGNAAGTLIAMKIQGLL